MDFRVQLDVFRGPLDLLLYLVRKNELEITEISVGRIAEQFLEYLDSGVPLDVDTAAEFLAMAGWLAEIKSHEVLPHQESAIEVEEPARDELVRRLLEYKKYRDAAYELEEKARAWQQTFRRLSDDLGSVERNPAEEPLQDVQLWDLVNAFVRIVKELDRTATPAIVYDDTPIRVFMERIYRRLQKERHIAFSRLFEKGMHKSTLIGIFLACLELVRHGQVRLEQAQLFGEIHLHLRENASADTSWQDVSDYSTGSQHGDSDAAVPPDTDDEDSRGPEKADDDSSPA
ncbi:segregation and condensation protein A [Thermopirellula anaerolimosa]